MSTKAVAETSKAAYDDLQPTLTARQRRVSAGLGIYYAAHGRWPTAYELFEALHGDDFARDLNDVRPRLTELKALGKVENPAKRCCTVTGKRAWVWRLTVPARLF
jgi:hypothetical protein